MEGIKTMERKLFKNKYGYYIIEGIGNLIYLPKKRKDIIEFIKDYLSN